MTDSDIQACAEIVLKGDPDRFSAVMAAPVAMRDVLFPLHALAIEVARAPWASQEPMIAEMRLQWWRDALEEIANGRTPRRHVVVTPLAAVLPPETARLLDGFVEVRRWDIYKDPFEDAAHFTDYLAHSSGSLYRAICQALGQDDGAASDFGFAAGLANYLRAVPDLERRGRVPLVDGRPQAIRALAQQGLTALKRARRARPSGVVARAFLPGWQSERILRMIKADPTRVAESRLAVSEAAKKTSLIWKAATARI